MESDAGPVPLWRKVTIGLALAGALLAARCAAGWILGRPDWTTLMPGEPRMAFDLALLILLAAIAGEALARGWRRTATVLALGCCLLALSDLAWHGFGWALGWNPGHVVHPALLDAVYTGRMSFAGGVMGLLVGCGMLALAGGARWRPWAAVLTGLQISIALQALLAHVLRLELQSELRVIFGISPGAAVGVLLVGLASAVWQGGTAGMVRTRLGVLAVFSAASMVLLVVGFGAWNSNQLQAESRRQVVHSFELIESVNYLELLLTRMESWARAYALGRMPEHLRYYDDLALRLRVERNHLQGLSRAEAPNQAGPVRRLLAAAAAKKRYMDAVNAEMQASSRPLAVENFRVSTGPDLMRQIRGLVNEIELNERAELALRLERTELATRGTDRIIFTGTLSAVLLLALAYALAASAERSRAQAAQQLAAVGRFQRAVLDGTVFSVIATDAHGLITEFNAGAEQMLGYRRDELVARRTPEVIHDANEVVARAAELTIRLARPIEPGFEVFVAQARLGEVEEREWTYVRKDGSRLPVLLNVTALRDMEGVIIGFLGVAQDLTERKAALAALRESEERFRTAFNDAGTGMALVGLDGRWLRVNRAICRIVGYAEEELLQKNFQDITHPEDLGKDLDRLRETLAGTRNHYQMEKRYLHRAGHIVWVRLTVSVVRDAAGAPMHFISQVEDVTERRGLIVSLAEARDQALEASRLKSEFLASMSHEIRTPMNGVIGMTSLLLDAGLDARQREMAEVIQRSAESLLTLIDDILDFSKIEAGKLRIEPTSFRMQPLVEDCLALLAPRAQEKALRLSAAFDPGLEESLLGDAGRIRQVLLNLVGNAVKFTARGAVNVRVRRLREHDQRVVLRIEVEDTGIGIPPAVQVRLFQPFVQADGSTTRRFGGTGLGLAICRQLVQLMGGEIGLISEERRGSTFWFELDLPRGGGSGGESRPVPAAAMVADSTAVPAAKAGRLRVLLVEDNATNRLVATMVLEKMGHRSEVAVDGREALRLLAQGGHDVVLMDCQMPELDGYATTRLIRAGTVPGANRDVPIIALTAFAMRGDRQKCLEAGMNDYVAKPLRVEDLQQALARCGLVAAPGFTASAPVATDGDEVMRPAQRRQLESLPGREHATLLQDLAVLFLQEAPVRLAALRARQRAGEVDALKLEAHRLAGSCASLGAEAMRHAAAAVEQAAAEPAALPDRLAALEGEWERLRLALQEVADRLPR